MADMKKDKKDEPEKQNMRKSLFVFEMHTHTKLNSTLQNRIEREQYKTPIECPVPL